MGGQVTMSQPTLFDVRVMLEDEFCRRCGAPSFEPVDPVAKCSGCPVNDCINVVLRGE